MSAAGAGLRAEGGPDLKKRALAAALVLLAVVIVAILLFRGDGGYRVTAEFVSAGQLVKGNEVKAGGVTVGSVKDVDVTRDGQAKVTLAITDGDYEPLRRGTRVMVKQASLSGIANRYVDLQLGPANGDEIEDGGVIGSDQTATAVELDEIFNLFDPKTRTGLQDFFKGSAAMLHGRGQELRKGVHYLNPAFSTGSRLFQELTRDDALLEKFLVDSGTLVNALADRRDDLTGVVGNLNATFGALGRQQDALAESVERLPPFMRRANTTFVNLRSVLGRSCPLRRAARAPNRLLHRGFRPPFRGYLYGVQFGRIANV
jgi:phospholipid/cholesterol/gamma-HCH transport system substrate-binding protein